MYIKGNEQTSGPIWNYAPVTLTSWKGAKLNPVIQLNCGELCTHASYKTTRTWENFNNRRTKIILPSDKLWLIANNSKSFANRSKSIIRNNLGLCKGFEIHLSRTFKNFVIDLFLLLLTGIHSMQCWTATTRHGVKRKTNKKRLRHTENLFRKNLQLKDVC